MVVGRVDDPPWAGDAQTRNVAFCASVRALAHVAVPVSKPTGDLVRGPSPVVMRRRLGPVACSATRTSSSASQDSSTVGPDPVPSGMTQWHWADVTARNRTRGPEPVAELGAGLGHARKRGAASRNGRGRGGPPQMWRNLRAPG